MDRLGLERRSVNQEIPEENGYLRLLIKDWSYSVSLHFEKNSLRDFLMAVPGIMIVDVDLKCRRCM